MKLALGTAQFGLDYGVANTRGKISSQDAKSILDFAAQQGIDTLDTAIAYGDSEQCLGAIGVNSWHIVTKLPAIPPNTTDVVKWLCDSVQGSLKRLNCQKLHGLLLHRPADLLSPNGEALYSGLATLRLNGVVEKIGISIYSPKELDLLWPYFHFDLIQAPFNILDNRLAASGWFTRLRKSGVELHTRSAFLQGLLLMKKEERPKAFGRWQNLWDTWESWLAEQQISPLQACLSFVLSQPEISRIIVGVDNLSHLKEILCFKDPTFPPPTDLTCSDEDLINPSRWSLL